MNDFNDDDDLMLNNIVIRKVNKQTTRVKKAELKKQKYATKINQKRKKTSQKPQNSSINPLISTLTSGLSSNNKLSNPFGYSTQSQNKQFKSKTIKSSSEQKRVSDNKNNNSEQKGNQENSRQRKSLSIKDKRSTQRSLKKVNIRKSEPKGTIDLQSNKIKMQQIKQIQPEKDLSRIQKLDKAPLQQLSLCKSLYDSLLQNQITKLTQIQTLSYASVFSRKDCIIKAATGSGKTLSYLIPIINQLVQNKAITKRQDGTTVLVVCPTRQLCLQAQKQAMRCLKRLPFFVTGCLVGGQQTNHQKSRIRKGIPLLFSTPGRLLYHLKNTQSFKLDNIKTFVFEQADRTLDMGFQSAVEEIIQAFQKKTELRKIQKILVSAHFNEKVQGLIQNLDMLSAKYIGFDKKLSQEVKKQQQGIIKIDQQQQQSIHMDQIQINASNNLKQQYVLIAEQQKIPFLLAYISVLPQSKIMIFVSTISEVEYIDYLLTNIVYRNSNGQMTEQKIQKRKVFKIHGDLDQKLRTKTYFQFRKEKFAVMISTQVASRGLDFPDLSHIILFDVPPTITDYGNRIGRSGRFNSAGVSLLLLHYQQSDYAQKIRYYNKDKPLQNIDKDLIYQNFERYLYRLNIRDKSLHYIEGIVRSMVKQDDEKYQLARKAYVSMLRAYARLTEKHIFHVKKLNLKMLSRTFGLNSAQADRSYNPKAKQSHFQTLRKKRKVQNIKSLQVSQYL